MRKSRLWTIDNCCFTSRLDGFRGPANAQMGVWRDINPDAYISPPANPQLNSIYMFSSAEGWAVGDSRPTTNATTGLPAIFHYDGSTWNLVPAPKIADFPSTQAAYNLTSISFGPPGNFISKNDGWAVGYNASTRIWQRECQEPHVEQYQQQQQETHAPRPSIGMVSRGEPRPVD